jgi:hypothetical protein
MSPGRILAFVCFLLAASTCSATMLVDPFLEDLRVGRYADSDDIESRDGWPIALFEPAHWSQHWTDAWHTLDAEPAPIVALLEFGFASREAATVWLAHRRETWNGRNELAAGPAEAMPPGLAGDLLAKRALDLVAQGADQAALDVISALLSPSRESGLDDLTRFTWSLRLRALKERLGQPDGADTLWPELLALGPYDRRSGWALWVLNRRHLGRSLLPAIPTDRRTVLFIASLRKPDLVSRDIDSSPYDADLRAALGAAVLPRSALRRHFGLYPDPPADIRLQGHWLQGRWRGLGYTAAAAERLAALPGVAHEHRAGYLRRAADKQASSGLWGSASANLQAAAFAADRADVKTVRERVRIEIERLATLTAYHDLTRAAAVFRALAEVHETVPEPGRRGRLESTIKSGGAAPLSYTSTLRKRGTADLLRWRAWAKLGVTLAADQPSWLEYGRLLNTALNEADSSEALVRRVLPAIGTSLRNRSWRDSVLDWILVRHMEQRATGEIASRSTPIPALVSNAGSPLETHLLLGLSMLLGDARGQLAATVNLSRPGLSLDEGLLLLYPVPTDPAVADLLEGSPVDPALVLAVARRESLFDPAVRSRSGALGWMQIMPFHYPGGGHHDGEVIWRSLGKSLTAGLNLLSAGIRRHHDDPYRALADYNAGPTAVDRWDTQLGGTAPPAVFLGWIGYPETRRYVEKVLIDRAVYAWILDGAAGMVESAPALD